LKIKVTSIKDPIIQHIYEDNLREIDKFRQSGNPDISKIALELGFKLGSYLREIDEKGFVEIEVPENTGTGRLSLIELD
jgi:hypothetical protein